MQQIKKSCTFAATNFLPMLFKYKKLTLKKVYLVALSSFVIAGFCHGQIPSGYYNSAEGLNGAALKTALYNIIKDHTVRSYDQIKEDFETTDDKPNGKVWDMYSDIPGGTPPYQYDFGSDECGSYNSEGDCYNREHSWPASWFNDASPMYSDMFHVVPADGYVNNRHGNYIIAEVNSATWTSMNGTKLGSCATSGYSGTVFEPIDAYKGDFARAYFYMVTRYENKVVSWSSNATVSNILVNNTFPAFETWYLNMLADWHVADPVDQKEIDRNDAIYTFQDNRNPFIDHPEYVYAIWGVGASTIPEPSNFPTNFSASNITLNWTDATGAIVSEGYLLRWSTVGFGAIADPVDGTPVGDGAYALNVAAGVQTAFISNLLPSTTYYFKLFGYTGSGATIDYKTDATVPMVMQTTQP